MSTIYNMETQNFEYIFEGDKSAELFVRRTAFSVFLYRGRPRVA